MTSSMSTSGGAQAARAVPDLVPTPPPGRWWGAHAGVLDLLITLAVLLYNFLVLPVEVPSGPMRPVMHALSVGLCAPYLLRRRFPLAVFTVTLAVAFLHVVLGTDALPADVMLLLSIYNVATRFSWQISLPATGLVVGWLLIAQVPVLAQSYLNVSDLGWIGAVMVLVWMWGTLVRTRREPDPLSRTPSLR